MHPFHSRRIAGLMLTVPLLLAAAPLSATELALVTDGQPKAWLALSAKPTRAAQLAALEIQHHVKLITGATLPLGREGDAHPGLAMHIGETDAANAAGLAQGSFQPQEYAVQFDGNVLFLTGRDAEDRGPVVYDPDNDAYEGLPGFWEERGTLHAAYDFLERSCGVRWLNPTDFGTAFPQARSLEVPVRNSRRRPAFAYRDACGSIADQPLLYDGIAGFWPENSLELKQWKARAYADLYARHPAGPRRNTAHAQRVRLFLLRMRNGGEVQRCNHSLYAYHARFWNNPETRRPEFFAKGYEGAPPQLCYTSPALIEQVAADARHYYDTGDHRGIFWNPRAPNGFPVEPMDNKSFCLCESCQAYVSPDTDANRFFSNGTQSDYFFDFVNKVCQALRKTHPDRGVVTLAYMTRAKPPIQVALDPNVAVQFCFSHSRSDPGIEDYRHERDLLRKWAADGSGRQLSVWLYSCFPLERARNANLHCWPGAFAHNIGVQMREFKDLGVNGFFHCGFGQDVEAFVTFKLMDDPALDVDVLLDDYFTGVYGGAAAPMKAFYLEIEKGFLGQAPTYDESRMAELEALVRQADAQAHSEREKRNLEIFKLDTWSYMQEGMRQRQRINETPIPSIRVPRVESAGGDAAKVDWSQSLPLPGPWHKNNSHQPTDRTLSGRIAHDGRHLYLELVDACDTAKLESSGMVFPKDTWEIFIATQRGLPFRQYAVNPVGTTVGLSHGEIAFRMNMPLDTVPMRASSDAAMPDRWIARLAWPLDEMVAGGVKPGTPFFLNVARVWDLPLMRSDGEGVEVWGPFTKVHDLSRAPELILE